MEVFERHQHVLEVHVLERSQRLVVLILERHQRLRVVYVLQRHQLSTCTPGTRA